VRYLTSKSDVTLKAGLEFNQGHWKSRSSFFSERVVNVWNKLPESVVFSSFASFARSIKCIDLSDFVTCYQ